MSQGKSSLAVRIHKFNASRRKNHLASTGPGLVATSIADMALDALVAASHQQEKSWSEKTRWMVIGYLVGIAKKFLPGATISDQEHAADIAYQQLCSSTAIHEKLSILLVRLEASKNEHYIAGMEAAVQDCGAMLKGQSAQKFFRVIQCMED